jgi:prepilin-type processing-associated H-X9-DG protein
MEYESTKEREDMLTTKRRALGYTLVELLTAVAIIGTLLALLFPAVQQAREASRRMSCLNNLKQSGVALHHHEASHGAFPASKLAAEASASGSCDEFEVEVEDNPGHCTEHQSWTAACLPYLEESALADKYLYDEPWSNLGNRSMIATELATFVCPSVPRKDRVDRHFVRGAATTDYATINQVAVEVYTDLFGVADPGLESRRGALAEHAPNPPRKIIDGLSKTLMVAESAGRPYVYALAHPLSSEQFSSYGGDEIVAFEGEFVTDDAIGWADPEVEITIKGASEEGLEPFGPRMINSNNLREAYSFHGGGAQFLFADGSVRFLADSLDPWVYVCLCTRAGSEVVDDFVD